MFCWHDKVEISSECFNGWDFLQCTLIHNVFEYKLSNNFDKFKFSVEMSVNWQIIKWKKLIVKYWCFSLEHCVNCQSHRSICESECTAIDSSILKVKQTKWFPSSKWEMIAVELHLHPRVMCQVTKRVLPCYRIVIWYWSHSTS